MIKHLNRFPSIHSPARHAAHLRTSFPDTLAAVASIMRHPRSLARPLATWRPPSITLPGTDPLVLTLSRMRVGDAVRDRVQRSGETRTPAYLITVRITDPSGHRVPRATAEAWVRALVACGQINAVHHLTDEAAPTFCWLVDGHFTPVISPASLFQQPAEAA